MLFYRRYAIESLQDLMLDYFININLTGSLFSIDFSKVFNFERSRQCGSFIQL
ncbi:hypothetical protein [Spirosoma litoris]